MSPHRSRMQKRLGRPFKDDEIVHHIDGDRSNNDEHNLAIMTKRAHVRLHVRERKLSASAKKWENKLAADKLSDEVIAAAKLAAAKERRERMRPVDPECHSGTLYIFDGSLVAELQEQLGWTDEDLAYCSGVSLAIIRKIKARPNDGIGTTTLHARLQLA